MNNTAITSGRLTVGKTYLFQNKADGGRSLNVWCNSTYPAENLSNVCLWKTDKNDNAQRWTLSYSKNGDNYVLKSEENSAKCLDLYTGTGSGANINAHLYSESSTSYLIFENGAYSNTVRIRLAGTTKNGYYLTANQGNPGSNDGRGVNSKGNVYFYSELLDDESQEWEIIDPDSSSGGGTYQKLIMPINQSVITVCYKENAPAYHEQGFSDPMHYAIDMTGTPRSFYASGDGTIVGYSATNSGPLGKWLAVRYDKVEGVDGKKYDGLVLRYCHLDDIYKTSGEVHINDKNAMAKYGKTGTKSAHLHVEVDTDTVNYNKTPTIKGNSNGLVPAGNDDTTIDPFLVFHKKISEPENQSVSWSQSYCDKDNCSICAQYTQYEPGKVPYVNIEQCRNVPEIS